MSYQLLLLLHTTVINLKKRNIYIVHYVFAQKSNYLNLADRTAQSIQISQSIQYSLFLLGLNIAIKV